jgi:hypothetical protein
MVIKAILVTLIVTAGLSADLISLTNDFSITNGNPNGQWSYLDGSTLLNLEVPLNNGNPAIPAVSNGYWGTGNYLNTDIPDFANAQVDGSAAGETNLHFLAGDIIGHAPNDGSTLFETWTAPSAGFVTDLSFSIQYAHSAAGARSNSYVLLDNSTLLTSGTVSWNIGFDRNDRASFTDAVGFAVAQGDKISIGITKSTGQSFGSIDGQTLDFTFVSSIPEPAPVLLAFSGLAALLAWRNSGRPRKRDRYCVETRLESRVPSTLRDNPAASVLRASIPRLRSRWRSAF